MKPYFRFIALFAALILTVSTLSACDFGIEPINTDTDTTAAVNPPSSEGSLTTDDPNKTVAQGIFFWVGSVPFINLTSWGEVYPVSFRVMNDSISFDDLTTGDTVEIIMDAWVMESFPCQGTLYELRKVSDGEMADLPEALVESMEGLGYTITEKKN